MLCRVDPADHERAGRHRLEGRLRGRGHRGDPARQQQCRGGLLPWRPLHGMEERAVALCQ